MRDIHLFLCLYFSCYERTHSMGKAFYLTEIGCGARIPVFFFLFFFPYMIWALPPCFLNDWAMMGGVC
ncbi:hypothetical protein M431DRAFT_179291 [Trichoderma harzianum CBS 226.95]|uniref:Uncharacterized protein n=1 Tax=Trichoderma harzianum CBS 226.95 TaxID=983964 RepID=A0A2T4ATL5_TRIHA|nr:hypothetical protein M431DRAFT_179291 [Trichoderma harzianum CBS 226.95]PTB60379.1 hypothetical protein M431DRAFT_179291 [Trichoderma harzianum CBS 226.95]